MARGNTLVIEANHNLYRLKDMANELLKSEEGIQKMQTVRLCGFDTEPVFANIKYKHHFKRFMLRGPEKLT